MILQYLHGLFGRTPTENVVGGSDEVFHAILENANGEKRYIAEFSEPELVDRGSEFSTDYMVRIPTETPPGDPEPPNIEYDLPDGEMGDSSNELFDLLDYYNIDQVSDLGLLEGETAVATFENGSLTLQLGEINEKPA